jgi:hypothetical protein
MKIVVIIVMFHIVWKKKWKWKKNVIGLLISFQSSSSFVEMDWKMENIMSC